MNGHDNGLAVRPSLSLAPRDLVAIGFRWRRAILATFFAVLAGAVLAAIFLPKRYESEIEILVHRERADPLLTSEPTAAMEQNLPSLTEEDINSEVAILKSQDLLEKVVLACDLADSRKRPSFRLAFWEPQDSRHAIGRATEQLESDLRVEPLKKSYIISVRYSSVDPAQAARVLNTLGDLYLEKHARVRRPPGATEFFETETTYYLAKLRNAEHKLAAFDQQEGIVADQAEEDTSMPKLAEFEFNLRQTEAEIPEAERHVIELEQQLAGTPSRITTEAKETANAALVEQLKSSLMTLELERTDLAAKYARGDRMVEEVEAQIGQVQGTIETQLNAPIQEETTNENPTYEMIQEELVKARADLASLKTLAAASTAEQQAYSKAIIARDQKQLEQQSLIRDVKAQEANYLLYLSKREEAHIADAFDQKRIVNASIAEAATPPVFPTNPPALVLSLGVILGTISSAGVALAKEWADTTLGTPEQVEFYLGAPVLASMPKNAKALLPPAMPGGRAS
jgi:uncharacterized protein involved in exopolysaccharide biosynthesis